LINLTQNGKKVATFDIAVNGYNGVDYSKINVWNNQAESCANYLSKGNI